MLLIGDDESSVDAGLVGVFGEAARGIYGMDQPVLARGKGLQAGIVHLSGDVYNNPGIGSRGGQYYLYRAGVTAAKRYREKSED